MFIILVKIDCTDTQEYCSRETAHLQCMTNEVVLIQEAIYGRRKVGKCIRASEIIQAMADDPLYIGCTADVLSYAQSLCAGRRECEIRVNDGNLEETKPCYSELKSYLEIAYTCISGTVFIGAPLSFCCRLTLLILAISTLSSFLHLTKKP